MISRLYRWLYHIRQHKAARRRLSGKNFVRPNWHRFSYNVFKRARAEKTDMRQATVRWLTWILGLPIGLFTLWFVWQSIEAIGMFQP